MQVNIVTIIIVTYIITGNMKYIITGNVNYIYLR